MKISDEMIEHCLKAFHKGPPGVVRTMKNYDSYPGEPDDRSDAYQPLPTSRADELLAIRDVIEAALTWPDTKVRTPLVVDAKGQVIEEGSKVLCGPGTAGKVKTITDPDGDMDEEGRPFGISPRVYVLWPEAEDPEDVEKFITTTSARGPWDDEEPYVCSDLELATTNRK